MFNRLWKIFTNGLVKAQLGLSNQLIAIISILSNINQLMAAHIFNFQLNSNIIEKVLLISRIKIINVLDSVIFDY